MVRREFLFEHFVWMTSVLVLLPTIILVVFVSWVHQKNDWALLTKVCIGGFLSGFFSAFAWLSWNPTWPQIYTFLFGAPVEFAQWQLIGCGLTLVASNVFILSQNGKSSSGLVRLSICTAAGFATAFSLGVSFGEITQEAIGVALSYIGIGIFLFTTNTLYYVIFKVATYLKYRGAHS